MPVQGSGVYKLKVLSVRLRDAGTEGQGLRRELMRQINDAARPLARAVTDQGNLRRHMPDRYADVLAADLTVRAVKSFSRYPSVTIRAQARKRKVKLLDQGVINHPVFAAGPRPGWRWASGQTAGMEAGFFTDPCKAAVPDIRDSVLAAMAETARKITSL